MIDQKVLWEELAKKNARYYVYSDEGRKVTEERFRESGRRDFQRFIDDDKLISVDGKFLEIGCGTGRMTEFIAKLFPIVIATDISSEMIRQGKERLKDISNIKWLETDGSTLPIEDGTIHVAFSYIVFPHIKTREMIESNFKEVYRVLKPNGLFKVYMRHDRGDNLEQWWGGVRYTEETIRALAERTGFKVLRIEPVLHCAYWVWLKKI